MCVSHSSLFLLLLHICAFHILLCFCYYYIFVRLSFFFHFIPSTPTRPNPQSAISPRLSLPSFFCRSNLKVTSTLKKKVPSQTKNFVLAHIESLRIKLLSLSLNLNCRGGGGGFSFCCWSATNIRVNFPQIWLRFTLDFFCK